MITERRNSTIILRRVETKNNINTYAKVKLPESELKKWRSKLNGHEMISAELNFELFEEPIEAPIETFEILDKVRHLESVRVEDFDITYYKVEFEEPKIYFSKDGFQVFGLNIDWEYFEFTV